MNLAFFLAAGIGVYGSFFAQPAARPQQNPPIVRNQTAPQQAPKPAVVCGMTLIPANPNIDRAMKIPTSKNRVFAITKIEPQICKR